MYRSAPFVPKGFFGLISNVQNASYIFLITQEVLFNQLPTLIVIHIGGKECREKPFVITMMLLNALQHAIGIFPARCQPLKFFRIINANKYFCFFSASDFIGCQPKQFHKTQRLQHSSESHIGKMDVTVPVSCVFSM